MKEKGISSYRLNKMGFPMTNYHSMRRGKNVSTHTLDLLWKILDCEISDVIEVIHTNEE
jgi:DNA-binding Xre family transcriptional regulator